MRVATLQKQEILRRWRRQILAHRDPATVAARQPFAALTFIDESSSNNRFVEIDHLLVVVAYEEMLCAGASAGELTPLRLAGYRVTRVPHGVQWGGAANAVLFKNLQLLPRRGARGQRIDLRKVDLASLALQLDNRLSRAARHSRAPWPSLALPRGWAGFKRHVAAHLTGTGPEFERACRHARRSPAEVFRSAVERHDGLCLYPLEWVDGELAAASAVLAEVTPSWQRRVFRIESPIDGLVGFQGACSFDFYNSRYRRQPKLPRTGANSNPARAALGRPERHEPAESASLVGAS